MNSIGNITFINQNQTTASTHIANKIANEDTQVVLTAQVAKEDKELKEQDVAEVEVENKIDDYLKEQKQDSGSERKKKKNNDDDKQNKSKINDNIDFSLTENNDLGIRKTTTTGIFSNFNTQKVKNNELNYEPLDIKA